MVKRKAREVTDKLSKVHTKEKNNFEKLIELKDKALEKKAKKIQKHDNINRMLKGSNKKIFDMEAPQALINNKSKKKSLFDIESEDDDQANNLFVLNVNEFNNEEKEKVKTNALDGKGDNIRSKKDVFEDIIRTSKYKRLEKTKMNQKI